MALSVKAVAAAKMPGRYMDGKGLCLVITKRGSRAWVLRYQLRGGRHDMGLGPASEISLAAARDAAQEARLLIRAGVDPLAARRGSLAARIADAAKARTFDDVLAEYLAAKADSWRNAQHRQQWQSSVRRLVSPTLGGLPVAAIDKAAVVSVLRPVWDTKPETGDRIRGRIETLLNFATANGYRPDGSNPAAWKGQIEHAGFTRRTAKARVHYAALAYAELPGFMTALAGRDEAGARALAFAILTAARSGEALGATWAEFDLAEKVWTVPAARMKAGREHRVPLSDAALALLGAPGAPGERLFPLGHSAMRNTMTAMGRTETVHGMRAAFSTWCAERTSYPAEIREAALAHTVDNASVVEAYQRSDHFAKRRRLMAEWARYCTSPAAAGEVVTLAR
jgi:integrase